MRIIVPFLLIALSGHLVGMESPRSSSPSSTSTKAKHGSTLVDDHEITIVADDDRLNLPTTDMSGQEWDSDYSGASSESESEIDRKKAKQPSKRMHASPKKTRKVSSHGQKNNELPQSPRFENFVGELRGRSDSGASNSSIHKLTQVYNVIRQNTSQQNHVAELLIMLNNLEPDKAQEFLIKQLLHNPDYEHLDDVTLQLCGAVARKKRGGANDLLKILLPRDYQDAIAASEGAKKTSDTQEHRSRSASDDSNGSLSKSISGILRGRKGAALGLAGSLILGLITNLTTYFVGTNPAALTQCNSQLSTCQVALDTCTKLLNATQ